MTWKCFFQAFGWVNFILKAGWPFSNLHHLNNFFHKEEEEEEDYLIGKTLKLWILVIKKIKALLYKKFPVTLPLNK